MLIVLLSIEQEYERLNEPGETHAHDLLTQIAEIHLTAETLNYEQIGAYAEALVTEEKKEAARRFPVIAAHIKKCSVCQALLEEVLDSLYEPERTE